MGTFYGEGQMFFGDSKYPNKSMEIPVYNDLGYVTGLESKEVLKKIQEGKYAVKITDENREAFVDYLNGYNKDYYMNRVGDASNSKELIEDFDKVKGNISSLNDRYKIAEMAIKTLYNVRMDEMNEDQIKTLNWAIDFRGKYINSIPLEVRQTIEEFYKDTTIAVKDTVWKPDQFYEKYNVGYDMASAYVRYLSEMRSQEKRYDYAFDRVEKYQALSVVGLSDVAKASFEEAKQCCKFYCYVNLSDDVRSKIETESAKENINERQYPVGSNDIENDCIRKYAKYYELTKDAPNSKISSMTSSVKK